MVTCAYIGNIQNVLTGHLPEELAKRWVSASSFKYGFELGSPKGISSLGEFVACNGIGYATSTEEGADHGKLIYGERFLTTAAFMIPHEAKATEEWKSGTSSLASLYQAIYSRMEGPTAFAGLISFHELQGTFITHSPVEGEGIFEHQERYYAEVPVHLHDVQAMVVGVLTDFQASDPVHPELERILYHNPFEEEQSLVVHTHGLLLKERVASPTEIEPKKAELVYHLFNQSTLEKCSLELFRVRELKPFQGFK